MAWQRAASLNSIPQDGVTGVKLDGVPVALYRLQGNVYATHGVCTHALALLAEGFVEDGKIECPLHQGVFDIRSGKALCAPLIKDVQTYAVKVEGDDVFVDLDLPGAAETRLSEDAPLAAMQQSSVVIVGAGQAAAAAIVAMREAGFNGTIDLVGDEVHLPYERPPLSKDMLSAKDTLPRYRLSEADADRHQVRLHLGTRAVAIDATAQSVRLSDGTTLPYDSLLLATGGRARRLAVPGSDLPGVLHLRTLEDAAAIERAFGHASHVGIIGGGFIGLELASAATARGLAVTLLEREPEIMSRLLPEPLGHVFRAAVVSASRPATKSSTSTWCWSVLDWSRNWIWRGRLVAGPPMASWWMPMAAPLCRASGRPAIAHCIPCRAAISCFGWKAGTMPRSKALPRVCRSRVALRARGSGRGSGPISSAAMFR
jgi:nitrite reductase/ring-hydroxylating ferredoxin subunit